MSASLTRNAPEAISVQQDERTSTPHQTPSISNASQQAIVRTKRDQVSAACLPCRKRKVKCDALRPCTACVKRKVTCQYETLNGETHSQASKRKYVEIARSYSVFAELFHMLANRSEQDATKIFHLIRRGDDPEAVLRAVQMEDTTLFTPDTRQTAQETFLVALAHSTGSLRDVVRLAALTVDPNAEVRLPDPRAFLILRNRIVRISLVETLLQRSERLCNELPPLLLNGATILADRNAQRGLDAPSSSWFTDDDTSTDEHPHEVPAAPWTTITASDEAVSHLVSLFLAWINPTWRFVESDLFLYGMRSKWLRSDFCSPFLVNSICAIASLHSEHDVAFTSEDRDRVTRGQHFHDEAVRLWALEEGRPTLTNIQALCVLSLESNYRAKDRLGLTLVPIAVQLNDEVPVQADEKRCAAQGVSKKDFERSRLSAHWTAKCTHVIMRIAFMSGTTVVSHISGLPKMHEVFKDEVEPWIAYPLSRDSVPHRPTLYLRERCRLAELFQEMHELIFPIDSQSLANIREFTSAVDLLSAKMQHWYRTLPFELHYLWPMSVAIWELHASYIAFLMTLYLVARNHCQEGQDLPVGHSSSIELELEAGFRARVAQEKLSSALPLAHWAAQILSDFRQHYGFKVSPAWLLQLQAVTASVLMLDPELKQPSVPASPNIREPDGTIRDSHTAFDEVFRCLLGTGVEVMIARGIARMMYHTAREQDIALSRSTQTLLQLMSNTAWRPSDLSLVNSIFPDLTTTKGLGDSGRLTELLSKWEKFEI